MSNTDDPASLAATALAHPPASLGLLPEGAHEKGVLETGPREAGPIGRTLNGRYKIKRLLGEGGMGGVYEGEHLEIGKRVAIKLVHSLHAHDPQIAARLKQEARSTSAIESEHIVQIFDAGHDEDLGLFLVMELLKGEDLGSVLARNKRLLPSAAAMLIAQAAWGLSRAHAAGIVHRDLKPANVFVVTRDDGSSLVKLVDFGIAKLVRDANQQAQRPGITRVGMVIGTPQYMSPEQAQGLPSVDQRTDVYSLGAVLFESIVGESPFREMPTYEQTILQIMTQRAPRLSERMTDIPPELDRLCAEMMAMDPAQRPQNMHAVRERILAIFPDVPGARASTRSLTNEIGNDVTAFAGGPVSGEVQRLIAAAHAAHGPGSGPVSGTAILRPATHSAVAVDSSARARLELADDDDDDDAVLPLSRRGSKTRKKRALIAGVSIAGLAVLVGIVAVARLRGSSEPKAQAGYGLVQSSIEGAVPAAPAASPTTPTAIATPPAANAGVAVNAGAAVNAPAATAVAPPSSAALPASQAHAAREPRASRPSKSSAAAAAKGNAAAPATKDTDAPVARPVGGTGVSTEF